MEDTFQLQARRFVEQVNREMYELGNLGVVDAVYSDGYTVHDPPRGSEESGAPQRKSRRAFWT